jgi:hypothetical protein
MSLNLNQFMLLNQLFNLQLLSLNLKLFQLLQQLAVDLAHFGMVILALLQLQQLALMDTLTLEEFAFILEELILTIVLQDILGMVLAVFNLKL